MRVILMLCLALLPAGCSKEKSTADLLTQLRDKDAARRVEAVKELGNRESDLDTVTPALIQALKDENAFVRRDAARVLGSFGPRASSAVSALKTAQKDKERSVRKAADEALEKIGAPNQKGSK